MKTKMITRAITKFRQVVCEISKEATREREEGQMAKVEMDFPKILITKEAYYCLTRFIDLCPTEIVGLGLAHEVEEGVLEIYDIFILPQIASGASAVIDTDAIAEYVTEMALTGKPTQDLIVWWHSHAEMGSFWSRVDRQMADTFKTGSMIGILGNHRHQFICRLDLYKPYRVRATDLSLSCPELEAIDLKIQGEIAQKVRNYGYRQR